MKLMGRNAGFIAAGAALASQDANFVLIPELPFRLEGEDGFLASLEQRVLSKNHCAGCRCRGGRPRPFKRRRDPE